MSLRRVQGRALYLAATDRVPSERCIRQHTGIFLSGEQTHCSFLDALLLGSPLLVSPVDVRAGSPARMILHGYEAGGTSRRGGGAPRRGWERVGLEDAEEHIVFSAGRRSVVDVPHALRDAILIAPAGSHAGR